MVWSKLKKHFESLLAASLCGRLSVHVTEYTRANPMDVGRGWITLDGSEVVSVQTPSFYSNNYHFRAETLDFGQAIHRYLSLSIDEAITSPDEIVSGLAFLDRRVGKRKLATIDPADLHPFSRALFKLRCDAEGIGR